MTNGLPYFKLPLFNLSYPFVLIYNTVQFYDTHFAHSFGNLYNSFWWWVGEWYFLRKEWIKAEQGRLVVGVRKWYGLCRVWKRLRTSVQENRGINGTAIFVFMIWRYVAFDKCSVLRYLGWDSEYFKLAYNVLRREMCISVVIELFDLGYWYLHINIIMFKVEFSLMWQEILKKT